MSRSNILTYYATFVLFASLVFPACAQQVTVVRHNDSDRAIVFIHGFHGDPVTTFTNQQSSNTWWQLMEEDTTSFDFGPPINKYDIITVDYTRDFQSCTSLEDMTIHVRTVLEDAKIYKNYNYVWFVAHSMGGLIVKRILSQYNQGPKQRLLRRVAGVVLLGVPAQGSPLAEQGTAILRFLVPFETDYECSMRDLRPAEANTTVQIIENQWKQFLESRSSRRGGMPRAYCAFEKLETCKYGICTMVVPRSHADKYCDGDIPSIDADHVGIAKPRDRNDFLYTWTRGRIETSARVAYLQMDKSWPDVVGSGIAESFGNLITRLQRRHGVIDPETGLPDSDEDIILGNTASGTYLNSLRTMTNKIYRGATWADLLERIGNEESCLIVEITSDRRRVSVSVEPELLEERHTDGMKYYQCM